MVQWLGSLLLALSALLTVPAAFLCLQLLTAALYRRAQPSMPTIPRRARLAVLMPAHDEEHGITAAIAAVRAALGPNDRLLVVADNCSDATAFVARAAGAEVTERTDEIRRGKGYALDHGVRWLERDPVDLVVIVDADCIVAPDALERLAAPCLATGRPVQALYLMHAPADARIGLRIAEFAWRVRNKLRPLGSDAYGWPCQLMGTGMAFPWDVIRGAPLATGHLVEDMQLGLDLAETGKPPLFAPDARVTSWFPSDVQGARAQRTRWEHGHLSVLASVGPRLFGRALVRGNVRTLMLALDLMVPPLAALAMGLLGATTVDLVWWASTGDVRALAVAVASLLLFTSGVLAAWASDGRQIVSVREMFAMPLYVAAKIPVYLRLFTKRQVEWVRTKRDDGQH